MSHSGYYFHSHGIEDNDLGVLKLIKEAAGILLFFRERFASYLSFD